MQELESRTLNLRAMADECGNLVDHQKANMIKLKEVESKSNYE